MYRAGLIMLDEEIHQYSYSRDMIPSSRLFIPNFRYFNAVNQKTIQKQRHLSSAVDVTQLP